MPALAVVPPPEPAQRSIASTAEATAARHRTTFALLRAQKHRRGHSLSRLPARVRSVKLTTQQPWLHYATFSKNHPENTAKEPDLSLPKSVEAPPPLAPFTPLERSQGYWGHQLMAEQYIGSKTETRSRMKVEVTPKVGQKSSRLKVPSVLCVTTAPHPPPWTIWRLRPHPTHPGAPTRQLGGSRSLCSPPRAAPKTRTPPHFNPISTTRKWNNQAAEGRSALKSSVYGGSMKEKSFAEMAKVMQSGPQAPFRAR